MKLRIALLILLGMTLASAPEVQAQQGGSAENTRAGQPVGLDALRFLVGDWKGTGDGTPGQGIGGFSCSFELQGKVLVRRNFAEYPATKEKPAFRHDDLMIVYAEGKGTRAIYFDNEGHVINYSVSLSGDQHTVTFLGDISASAPRFKFIYNRRGDNELGIEFDIAPPGKPDEFSKYIEARVVRK